MKYLFLVLGPICIGFLFGCAIVKCQGAYEMQPDASITRNLLLFDDFYPEYATDYEVETIAHHYMTQEDDPDAYGHILVDFDNVEVSLFVYKGPGNQLYWYKVEPYEGAEYEVNLTPEQVRHVWSFE